MMLKIVQSVLFLSIVLLYANELPQPAQVAKSLLSNIQPESITFQADNGFLYSKNELQHIAFGKIPADAAASGNPLHAIKEYHQNLEKLGITLLLVPVPPKLALHPCAGLATGDAGRYLQEYYQEMRKAGIKIIDLIPVWTSSENLEPFCRSDAHWSPDGIEMAAKHLAEFIPLRGQTQFTRKSRTISINGDLQASLKQDGVPQETLTIHQVTPEVWAEDSPVLLIGDSHLLFLSSGADMLAENAGFGEQLAYWLQMPVDRIAVKGSAANAARINLFRKASRNQDWLKSKKYVIWCFSSREFTGNIGAWRNIPATK